MMKCLILITALGVVSPVAAETVKAQIEDRYTNISGALLGMLLGGLIGKGVTGDDGGAAAGAVFGGIIGADKGSQSKTTQQVTGYTQERQCTEVTHYKSVIKTVYDYSVITWNQNGVVYSETFTK